MIEYLEIHGVGTYNIFLIIGDIFTISFILHQHMVPVVCFGHSLHFWKFFFQNITKFAGRPRSSKIHASSLKVATKAVYSFMIRIMLVIVQIVLQDQQKDNA